MSTPAPPQTTGEGSGPSGLSWTPFTPARIATIARLVFIVLALVASAYFARAVVLPILMAWVISLTLKAPVRWLRSCHVPTPLAAAITVALFVAVFGFAAVHLGRPAVEWVAETPDNFPRLKEKFQHILRPAARLTEAASSVGDLTTQDTDKKAQPVEVKDHRMANTVFTWTSSLLAGAAETVALVFLVLAAGDLFMLKLVRVMPRLRDKKHAVEISREIHQSISTYLLSVGLINLGFGVATGLALHALGLPKAAMWGGVVAFANFIPYLGPVLGISAVGLAGLLAFDTIGRGLLPAGAYLVLHLIEANAVTPFILGRRFALNPVIIFVALIFCVWMWGVFGALLAVPLLVTAKVICDRVPSLNFLGEMLSLQEAPELVAPTDPGPQPRPSRLSTTPDSHAP